MGSVTEQIIITARNEARQALRELEADSKKAGGAIDKNLVQPAGEANKQTKPLTQGLTGVGKALLGIAASGAAATVLYKTADFLASSVVEAEAAAKTQAQLEAVLRSTGSAAGITAGEINNMATNISRLTGVEDDLLVKNSAVMLTFKEVGGEVFPRAMQAATDMSAVIGQDLQSSVIQLGKALNDPIEGVSALSRVGVSFTEEQKEMIKGLAETGRVAEAQAIILGELESEFGGSAEAMHEAGTKSEDLTNAIGNLKEEIGRGLIPVTRDAKTALAQMVNVQVDHMAMMNDYRAAVDAGIISQAEYNLLFSRHYMSDAKYALKVQENLTDKIEFYNQVMEDGVELGKIKAIQFDKEAEAARNAASAADLLAMKYNVLSTILGGTMTQDTVDFKMSMYDLNQEAIVLQDNIDKLKSKGHLTKAQQASLDELKGKLGENQEKVKELAAEHDKASKQIILGFAQQAAMADGVITQQEFDKISELGKAFGLYDRETATAISNVKAYLEDGGMSVDQLTGKIDTTTSSIGKAIGKTRNLAEELAKLKDKKITVTVNTVHTEGGIRPGAGRAAGGSVVSGHSYVVGEKGPEILTMPPGVSGYITPNDKIGVAGGGGPVFYIGHLNVYAESGDALDLASNIAYMAEAQRAAGKAGLEFAG